MAQAANQGDPTQPGSSVNPRGPKRHPSGASDDEPDFDIHPDPEKLKASLTWQSAIGRVAQVGLSRQFHQLLHSFEPASIGPSHGPYPNSLITQVFSRYIVANRHLLQRPNIRAVIFTDRIPEFQLVVGKEQLLFSEIAAMIRKHLVLLDITD